MSRSSSHPRPGAGPVDVTVRWNGATVARQTWRGPTRVSWFIEGDVGVNDLSIEAEPGAIGIGTRFYASG